MKTKSIVFGLMVLLAGILLVPVAAKAITVSPPRIELDAAKGDVINQTLKVRNESTSNVTYFLSAERFVAGNEGGQPEFVGQDIGLATWISFGGLQSITIPAGETVEVPFTIAVPNYAGPGGYYAAIFLSTLPPEATAGTSQVSIASKIGTLLLVKIAGEINENAVIDEFKTSAESYLSLPIDFNIRVNNSGNVHLKPMGTILVKNMFGAVAGKVTVNENGGNVLPAQVRKFDASWVKNSDAKGATSFLGKYRQEKENYAFGKYTADLNLAYGTAGKVLTAKTSFWVIPWHVIIVNLVIILIVIVALYFIVKKYNKWLLKNYSRMQKKAEKK